MLSSRILITFVLASLLSAYDAAMPAGIRRISFAEGLPSRYPYRLALSSGVLWATMRAPQGAFRIDGLVRINGKQVTRFTGIASGLRSDAVNDILASGDMLYAATDKGLHRSRTDRFEAVGDAVFLTHLAQSDDGTIWAFGSDETSSAVILRGEKRIVHVLKKNVRPIRLFALSATNAWLVHDSGIFSITDAGIIEVPLAATSLWKEPVRGPERTVPSVWLYGAAAASGSVYIIGHTKKLVRYENGSWQVMTNGHFGRIAAHGGQIFVSDLSGSIFACGKTMTAVFSGAVSIDELYADSRGSLWAEVQLKRNEQHILIRSDAPYTSIIARHPLGTGSTLSPGICDIIDDGTVIYLATNDGVWIVTR